MTPIASISPPSRDMIAPLPNCFSMAAMAPDTAFIFSLMLDMVSPCWVTGSHGHWLVEHAVLQGLGEVDGADGGASLEVGDGAGHAARHCEPSASACARFFAVSCRRAAALRSRRPETGRSFPSQFDP